MGERIYRTADGRHVKEGDPEAAFLAYSQFDTPPVEVLAELEPKKRGPKPADKSRKPDSDKQQSRQSEPESE